MGVEFELKYTDTARKIPLIMNDLSSEWYPISMETTYYDTPSGSLSKKHYTLRHRLENKFHICTVKTPLTDGARGEWETECCDIRTAVPELCKLGAPEDLVALTEEGLEAVCGARFHRNICTIQIAGTTLEIALDEGILFSGSRQLPLHEVEVELKSGHRFLAVLYAKHLAKKYNLQPQPKSKFRRALDLREE
jgi:inorganic triphosphatase YgiF